jgi:hypothetical protein
MRGNGKKGEGIKGTNEERSKQKTGHTHSSGRVRHTRVYSLIIDDQNMMEPN